MAKLSQSLVERFFDSVGTKAQEVYNSSPADLTIDAEIVSIVDISIGEYKVDYQGNIMSVYSENPEVIYKVGERVYIIVPQGEMSRKKLIFGRSSYKTTKDVGVLKNFYVDQGPNFADFYFDNLVGSMQICSCPADKESILEDPANYHHYGFFRDEIPDNGTSTHRRYQKTKLSEDVLKEIDNQVDSWSRKYGYLKIQASFKTTFSGLHNAGKYSLQVACLQTNPKYLVDPSNEEQYNIITYELGIANFDGVSPYSIIEPSLQKAYFQIPIGGIVGIYSIGLIQDGDMQLDIRMTYDEDTKLPIYLEKNATINANNIEVSNIQICFAEQINLSDNLYYPHIETPFGTDMYAATTEYAGKGSVELIAHLYYGDTDITEDEHCRIHWFRQTATVTDSSAAGDIKDEYGKTYFDYGGPGWYPVEKIEKEQQAFDTTVKEFYKVEGNKLTVYIDAVPWRWKYKAVITYSVKERGEDGYEYIREVTSQYAIVEVTRIDSVYDLELVADTTQLPGYYKIINHKEKVETLPWIGTWYLKGLDDSYNQIPPRYHRGSVNILQNPFSSWSTIYVQCYDPYLYNSIDGDRSDNYEVAVLEKQIGYSDEEPFIVDWEGDDHFQYDAQGTWRGEQENKKYVLTPVLRFAEGCAFNYSMKILAPDGADLFNKEVYLVNDLNGWANGDSLLKEVWVDTNYGINFSVDHKYDAERAAAKNNTFTLEIYADNQQKYTFRKQITFSKDGNQGTNGTEWDAAIRPCRWQANDKNGLFVEPFPEDEITPLVVYPSASGIPGAYSQNNNYRLILRPYVSKAGVLLEELDKEQAYYYTCSWDVRAPGNTNFDGDAKLSSFLRLYHVGRPNILQEAVIQRMAIFNITNANAWEVGDNNLKVGTGLEDIKTNTLEAYPDGLVAHTVYPLNHEKYLWDSGEDNPFENAANECYGAVEVCYFDNQTFGTGASLEQTRYRFIVKCTIDIHRSSYNYENHEIDTAAYSEIVTSLVCYYPVDVFFDEEKLLIDPATTMPEMENFYTKIHTNWPIAVKYDAIGYNPEHQDEVLNFIIDGDEKNYIPEILTPETINTEKIALYQGIGMPAESYNVKFRPVNHLTKNDGYHGAYRTVIGDWPYRSDPKGVKSGWFLRNVILYYNRFGNADINGWDGQGLDTNEKDGTIFGVTFGAGWKGQFSNAFTGVLMGVDKNMPRKNYQENVSNLRYPIEAEESHPYLTGLFGYQEGIQSFGLLENGTAFFGRADRGGRIIIDGSNATIYGGANGMFKSPSIADPMWNTLRINLVDLTHQKNGGLWSLDPNTNDENPEISITDSDKIPTGYKVRNEDGEPVDLNFDGNSFGFEGDKNRFSSNTIPKWYADIWRNAYIQPVGSKPYWMIKDPTTHRPYEIDDLNYWDGTKIEVKGDSNNVYNNKRINYYDNSWIGIDTDSIRTDYGSDEEWYDFGDKFVDPQSQKRYEYFSYLTRDGQTVPPSIYVRDDDGKAIPNPDYPELAERLEFLRKKGAKLSLSSFGSQRASTTPAIEIGQHIPGLRPGLIGWNDYETLFETLRIPGDRNFMVTYDGTLWAMNGVFMGNVIGANIVGGRIQASQIGVGPRTNDILKDFDIYTFAAADAKYKCEWENLVPPQEAIANKDDYSSNKSGYAMTLDEDGISTFGGELIGGSLDVGHFHVIGYRTMEKLEENYGWEGTYAEKEEEIGHLIQNGKSDFIGLTHFYGNVGIAPSLINASEKSKNSGSLVQVGGFTALGVVLQNATDLDSHQLINSYISNDRGNYYFNAETSSTSPVIGKGRSVEQSAVFVIDSRGTKAFSSLSDEGIKGHFWPLHFRIKEENGITNAYVTMMDQFKLKAEVTSGSKAGKQSYSTIYEGSNYFRISPWGLEGQTFFVRNKFQSEQTNTKPAPDAGAENGYRGYIGAVSRAGYAKDIYAPAQGALGITTWNGNAIILHSDDTFALRNRKSAYFHANMQTENLKEDQTWTELQGDWDRASNLAIQMTSAQNNGCGTVQIKTIASPIGLAVLAPRTSGGKTGEYPNSSYCLGEFAFNPIAYRHATANIPVGGFLSINPYGSQFNNANKDTYDTFDTYSSTILAGGCTDIKEDLLGGGVHVFCYDNKRSDIHILSSDCRNEKYTETFWGRSKIQSWASDRNAMLSDRIVYIGLTMDESGNGNGSAHKDNIVNNSRSIYIRKNSMIISHPTRIAVLSENSAEIGLGNNSAVDKGFVFGKNNIELKGYEPESQKGIYARFA